MRCAEHIGHPAAAALCVGGWRFGCLRLVSSRSSLWMEVTRTNFPSVLQEISSLMPRCYLVSFDCEFTGLRGNDTRENWEDTPDERYNKLRRGCSEFSLIQYGLCLFVAQETEALTYQVFPFNFYLFPCHSLGWRLDRCFRCQPSSLTLLSNSGLDFNKWIREGIPYMRETDELWWRRRRKEAEEPSDEELNRFLGFSQVFKIIADSKIPLVGHSILLDLLHTYSHFIDDLPETLASFKSELNKRLPSLYDTHFICENSSIRGECQVMQALCGLQLLDSLRASNLPDKDCDPAHHNCIFRTTNEHLGPSLSLANVYRAIAQSQLPQITTVFPTSCVTYGSGNHLHEAAYDAYLSGYVFLVTANVLGGQDATNLFEAVESLKNRVYLFNCESADSLNLTGHEVRAPRNHVFYLTFPKEVTKEDIKNLFSPFGGCRVSWINDTNARVSLNHRNKAEEAYKALAGGGSMGKHLFKISKHQLKSPTSTTKSEETVQHHMLLGKRKKLEETSEAPSTSKANIFEESVDW